MDTFRITLKEPSPEVKPAIQYLFISLGIETEGRVDGITLGKSLANSGLNPLFKEALKLTICKNPASVK